MKTTDSTSKSGQSSEYGIVVVCNSKTDGMSSLNILKQVAS